MLKSTAVLAVMALILLVGCSGPGVVGPEAGALTLQPDRISTSIPITATGSPVPSTKIKPDIPAVVETLSFGFPAGNGHGPQRVAVDSQSRRLYSFNLGLPEIDQGNTVSAIDLESGEVTNLLRLENLPPDASFAPTPVDLQIDPFRPRLYALWGDPFAGSSALTLTIVDTGDLSVVATLDGVGAIAPGPEQIYLANETRLWAIDPTSGQELSAQELELRQFNRPLRLDATANRLYLGRGQPWSVEIFAADTLRPAGGLLAGEELIELLIDPVREGFLAVYTENRQTILQAFDSRGLPRSGLDPLILADEIVFSRIPVAVTGQDFYWVGQNSQTYDYFLRRARLSDLSPQDSLPLAHLPYDLAFDPAGGQLYTAYGNPDSFLLAIDPAGGNRNIIYTAVDLVDALADPDHDRLYVLANNGDLHILSLNSSEELDRVQTGFNTAGRPVDFAGELALDSTRQRLYLSGDPVRVVDTGILAVTTHPDLRGQLTPDPSSDRAYLTPPCRCREEQCNTLILDAGTLTGTGAVFTPADPFTAPCVIRTDLDEAHQLLYTTIYNGVPGSNSGDYLTVFDTQSLPPEQLYSDWQISYGRPALDQLQGRAFVPRYRMDRSTIHRLEAQGQTVTETLTLAGTRGQLTYDFAFDRLYAVNGPSLQVFDGDLALLVEISLSDKPDQFEPLTFDPQGQRLYLQGVDGQMLLVATGGGQLQPPQPVSIEPDQVYPQKLLVAPDGTRFRLDSWRLYRSRDEGQTWQLLGRGLPGHPVNDIAISPLYRQDRTLLAGLWNFGRGGGLYRSTDGGDTWRPTTRGLTDLEIQQIDYSPTFARDQTIFVITRQRGLFHSTDGGNTWKSLAENYAANPPERGISHLAVSPTFAEDGLIFIGHNQLLRSTDGGQSWADTGLPPGPVAFSPEFSEDGLVLSEGRWRSTDRGQSWEPAAAGLEPARQTRSIFFSPDFAGDRTVYLLLQPDFEPAASLQRSTDAGQTWESVLAGLPDGFALESASLLPDGQLHLTAGNGETQIVGPDRLTWGRRPIDLTQLDLQALAVGPDGDVFVANSAAGVHKSEDGGRTWQATDFPARASDLFPAHLAAAGDGTLFGAVGAALERSPDGGQSWTYLENLPVGFTITSLAVSPDYANDGVLLAGGNYSQNQLLRSADGGDTWEVVFDGTNVEGSSDLSLIAFSPNFGADGMVYAWLQEGGLLRSIDGGLTWELINGEQGRYFGQSLVVGPQGDRLYLGALDGRLLVSTDRGESWTDLGQNIPGNRIWSSALVFATDGAILLGTDVGLLRSRDGGETWTEASNGLPLDPIQNTPQAVRALAISGDRLYAALTRGGLFVSDDQGESWQNAEQQ